MKNRIIITLAVTALCSMPAAAQEHHGKAEKTVSHVEMAKARTLEIASKIGLDEATTAKFSEIYLQFLKETGEVMKDVKRPEPGNSDEEIDRNIRNNFAFSRKMLDLREKYYEKFLTIMTPTQIQNLYKQEFERGHRFGAGNPQHHVPQDGGPQHHGPRHYGPQKR